MTTWKIGTAEDCDVRIAVGVRDKMGRVVSEYVAGHHAEVVQDADGRYWVRDLGSTNGTFIAPNGRGPYAGGVRQVRQLTRWPSGWTLWLASVAGIPQP